MGRIHSVDLCAEHPEAVERVIGEFGLSDVIHVREGSQPTEGFRGFAVSLVSAQPGTVDFLFEAALRGGAEPSKPPAKSLWGYGAAVRSPDGTVWTLASSAKKQTGPVTAAIDDVVLLLGVSDVKASKQFYLDRGLRLGKSYGGKYAELETGERVKLALSPRKVVAKNAGVPIEGSGSHRLVICGDVGVFSDPDGYTWEQLA